MKPTDVRVVQVTGGWILHVGSSWVDAPIPARRHRCVATTVARLGVMHPQFFRRCACGAWSKWLLSDSDWTPWQDRNSRRRGTAFSLTVL